MASSVLARYLGKLRKHSAIMASFLVTETAHLSLLLSFSATLALKFASNTSTVLTWNSNSRHNTSPHELHTFVEAPVCLLGLIHCPNDCRFNFSELGADF